MYVTCIATFTYMHIYMRHYMSVTCMPHVCLHLHVCYIYMRNYISMYLSCLCKCPCTCKFPDAAIIKIRELCGFISTFFLFLLFVYVMYKSNMKYYVIYALHSNRTEDILVSLLKG